MFGGVCWGCHAARCVMAVQNTVRAASSVPERAASERAVRALWTQRAPGVESAQLLQPEIIAGLRRELARISTAGIPTRRPNGMNRYGVILDAEAAGGVPVLDGFVQGLVNECVSLSPHDHEVTLPTTASHRRPVLQRLIPSCGLVQVRAANGCNAVPRGAATLRHNRKLHVHHPIQARRGHVTSRAQRCLCCDAQPQPQHTRRGLRRSAWF
jgi:hypothetical protein